MSEVDQRNVNNVMRERN